jgi:DNA replication and repair protein RecF
MEEIAQKLKNNRKFDTLIKKCSYGTHKSVIKFVHPFKQTEATSCSTGEKKAMLISLVIAQSMVLESIFNGSIILLLDDIFSHLDNTFSQNLLTEISKLSAQCWITGTHHNTLLGKDYVTLAM